MVMTEDWFEEVHGVRLHVRKLVPENKTGTGEKPVVVFLHEGLGSVDQWKDFPGRFLEMCQMPVLLYDRLGYGKSSPRKEKRGLDYLHREEKRLSLLIRKLSLKKYLLLGHSEGGSLALIHAARQPEGLRGVVTLSANTQEEPCITPGIEKVKKEYEKPGSKLKSALQKYHGAQCDRVFYAWCDTWTAPFFQVWNIKNELKKITVPLLAVHGRNDQYTSLLQIKNIEQYVSSSKKTVLLDACGHHPHFDHPDKVMEAICDFLKQF